MPCHVPATRMNEQSCSGRQAVVLRPERILSLSMACCVCVLVGIRDDSRYSGLSGFCLSLLHSPTSSSKRETVALARSQHIVNILAEDRRRSVPTMMMTTRPSQERLQVQAQNCMRDLVMVTRGPT